MNPPYWGTTLYTLFQNGGKILLFCVIVNWLLLPRSHLQNTYRLFHRKCFVRIFIHSLQNFGKLTRLLRSLVRFPKFCNE